MPSSTSVGSRSSMSTRRSYSARDMATCARVRSSAVIEGMLRLCTGNGGSSTQRSSAGCEGGGGWFVGVQVGLSTFENVEYIMQDFIHAVRPCEHAALEASDQAQPLIGSCIR